jgi:hypothetical protein
LVAVKGSIFPVAVKGIVPIFVLVLVQLKTVPAIVVGTKLIGVVSTPLQKVCDNGITISGAAFAVYE